MEKPQVVSTVKWCIVATSLGDGRCLHFLAAEDEEKTQKDVQTTAEPSAASAFYQMDHLDGPLSSFENEFPFF